jgi:isoleucyl-tRNA synthetase
MEELDRWALHELQRMIGRVTQAYDKYEFYTAFHALYNYCTVSLSSLYFDMLKDRLYTFAADNPARRSSQTALNNILHALTRMLAPALAFTAEEAWRMIPNQEGREPSIHLCEWPKVNEAFIDEGVARKWERLLEIRASVTKALEVGRRDGLIRNSLEAKVVLYPNPDGDCELLKECEGTLRTLFIVSQVELRSSDEAASENISAQDDGMAVCVLHADGQKCERCWNYSEQIGESELHPSLCERCVGEVGG